MKCINSLDPVELGYSTARVTMYLLESEVESFVTDGCPKSHIFVDAVLVGQLDTSNIGTLSHKIYEYTSSLIENFDETKADELMSLVKQYKMDTDKFLEDF